jgi:hypothetical protein
MKVYWGSGSIAPCKQEVDIRFGMPGVEKFKETTLET